LPEQLAELQDALVSILSNYTDLIKKGISGSLSNVDKLNLAEFAKSFGFKGTL